MPSTNPAIATAVPVNELSSEITTGMSAPPIGRTMVTPKMRAAARITSMTGTLRLPAHRKAAPRTVTAASTIVTIRPPGIRIGFPAIRPWSLPDAISEPENVMLPITMSRTVATLICGSGAAFSPR